MTDDQEKALPGFTEWRGGIAYAVNLFVRRVLDEYEAATERDLTSVLQALDPKRRARVLAPIVASLPAAELATVMLATPKMTIDEATDLESERILAMSDEEVLAEYEHPERAERWGAANARWVRTLAEECRKRREAAHSLAAERARVEELERERDEALATVSDLVRAMRIWGNAEDGIPDRGPVASAFDRGAELLRQRETKAPETTDGKER
jgi:hypothetical protein